MRLYRGPFLDDPPDGWALVVAQRLHGRYLDTLRKLVILAQSSGDPAAGLEASRLWQQEEPWEENAQLAFIRALIACGDYQEADNQLNRALSILDPGNSGHSNPAFRSLAREINRLSLKKTSDPAAQTALSVPGREPPLLALDHKSPLIGRQAESEALSKAWHEIQQGYTRAVIVEGAAGIGKSRLVEELVSRISFRSGSLVLQGVANERTPDIYLGLLRDCFQNLTPQAHKIVGAALADLDELAWAVVCRFMPEAINLLPERAPGELPILSGEAERILRTESLATFIDSLCRQTPVLILLEDCHFADEETRALVQELLQKDRYLLLLFTQQPTVTGKTAPFSYEISREKGRVSVLRLTPLLPQEVDELIQHLLMDQADARLLEQLCLASGGVPLFVHEILRALFEHGDLDWHAGSGWSLRQEAISLPAPLSILLKERLAALSTPARELADLLAVCGRPVEEGLLDQLWADKDILLSAQAELIRKQVALETQGRLLLAHGWLGERIRASLEHSRRVSFHARLAAALRAIPTSDPAERAYHQAQAGEWAAAYQDALAAGERDLLEGRSTSPTWMISLAEEAVEKMGMAVNDPRRWPFLALRESFYASVDRGPAWLREQEAMEQLARDNDRPDWLIEALIRRGRAQRELGKPGEAEMTLRRAADLAQQTASAAEVIARSLLSAVLDDRGAAKEALLEAERASQIARDGVDDLTRLRSLINLAYMQMRSGKVEEAKRLMNNLLADPAGHRQPVIVARAMRQLGIIQIAARDYESGLENLRQSVQYARKTGDLHSILICQTSLVYELTRFGLFIEGQPLAETTLELARRLQAKSQIGTLLNSMTGMAFYRGDLEQAWMLAQDSVASAEAAGLPEYVASSLSSLAAVALSCDHNYSAREAILRAERILAAVTHPTMLTINHIAARVWLSLGDRQRAGDAAYQAVNQVVDKGIPAIESIGVLWEAANVIAAVEGQAAAQPVYIRAYERLISDMGQLRSLALRRVFLNAHPAHRALLDFTCKSSQCLVLLPLRGVPTGRPLHNDELAPVVWTVHTAEDPPLYTAAGRRQRQQRMCTQAKEQGTLATVERLAKQLSVSARTVQRDLQHLRLAGSEVETYGERSGGG